MNTRSLVAKDALGVVALVGAVAIAIRLMFGLGASTALSDGIPWGLWKILNMVAGVALATGGFALACVVYVLGLEKYRPLLRPALLTAFLGYGSSCFALLLDIGLPHRIWHPIFYWNEHSFLFEVAWCVMLYFTVTGVEMMPVILEKFPYPRLRHWLHQASIPVVITGITLSTLHHTSLGSLFLVAPSRLHEIWYTAWLPILFYVSAVGAGMMTVVLLTLVYAWLTGRQPRLAPLTGVAKVAAVALALHFALKLVDITRREIWDSVLAWSAESMLLAAEMLLGAALPCLLVFIPRARGSIVGLTTASAFAATGLVLNRLNVGLFGFFASAHSFYWPSLPEWAVSLGVVAAAGLAFIHISERFEVFETILEPAEGMACSPLRAGELRPMWQANRYHRLRHATLLPVLVIPVAVFFFWNDAVRGYPLRETPVSPPTAMDEARAVLRIDADADGDFVLFEHLRHQKDFREEESCQGCHHTHLPGDPQTPCFQCHFDMFRKSSIFDHDLHAFRIGYRMVNGLPTELAEEPLENVRVTVRLSGPSDQRSEPAAARLENLSCTECHDPDQPRLEETTKACTDCHGQDMGIADDEKGDFNRWAVGHTDAMHDRCVTCHETEGPKRERPELGECATCHLQNLAELQSKSTVLNSLQDLEAP